MKKIRPQVASTASAHDPLGMFSLPRRNPD